MEGLDQTKQAMRDSLVPDGIFVSSKGRRVAFELESSSRKLSRFEAKASEYESLMRRGLLDRVLWVACAPEIQTALGRATAESPRFTLGSYQEFHKQLFPGGGD